MFIKLVNRLASSSQKWATKSSISSSG